VVRCEVALPLCSECTVVRGLFGFCSVYSIQLGTSPAGAHLPIAFCSIRSVGLFINEVPWGESRWCPPLRHRSDSEWKKAKLGNSTARKSKYTVGIGTYCNSGDVFFSLESVFCGECSTAPAWISGFCLLWWDVSTKSSATWQSHCRSSTGAGGVSPEEALGFPCGICFQSWWEIVTFRCHNILESVLGWPSV
jgi:hypothetical protein